MSYTVAGAQRFVGKRVVVSLRHRHADGNETFTGLWGVVESAHEDGLLLKVEGGSDESHWDIPPDLEAFQPAQHAQYQFGDTGPMVTAVDYEMYWSVAAELEQLQ